MPIFLALSLPPHLFSSILPPACVFPPFSSQLFPPRLLPLSHLNRHHFRHHHPPHQLLHRLPHLFRCNTYFSCHDACSSYLSYYACHRQCREWSDHRLFYSSHCRGQSAPAKYRHHYRFFLEYVRGDLMACSLHKRYLVVAPYSTDNHPCWNGEVHHTRYCLWET